VNTADVLQLFVDEYAAVPAPAPSRLLAARMDAGWIGSTDDDRGAVVVPFVARPRVRMRYLAAALVATFVAMSGLAVAGALPDPLQRGVASVVSHLGIDLPRPDGRSGSTPTDGGTGGHGSGGSSTNGSTPGDSGSGSGSGADSGHSGSGSSSGSSGSTKAGAPTTSTTLPDIGGLGGLGSTPTTLPPVTLPPVTVPPISLPPISLPPLTLPPISLPPISLPPLPPGL
jgi:hypothetical protein